MSPHYFLFYIQNEFMYKIICLKSPTSSKFAILLSNSGQKSYTMFISSCFNNCSIGF